MTLLARVRATASRLTTACAAAGFSSADAYDDQPRFHAMAAGRYLSAQAVLCSCGLLSPAALSDAARGAVTALDAHAVRAPGIDGPAWGLGFAWKDLPADEPFLVTTALVAQGLADAARACPTDAVLAARADAALGSLSQWCEGLLAPDARTGIAWPAYSPRLRRPIYNAAAVAWGALHEHAPAHAVSAGEGLARLHAARSGAVGWVYEPGSEVVDLVHQCYLLGAVCRILAPQEAGRLAVTALAEFVGPNGWVEALRVQRTWPERAEGGAWVRARDADWLLLDLRPARAWSLGEALALAATLARAGAPGWRVRARGLGEQACALADDAGAAEAGFFRHTMHLAHGMARLLATERAAEAARSTS